MRRELRSLAILLAVLWLHPAIAGETDSANWRISKIEVTLKEPGKGKSLRLYASLRNLGKTSSEEVRLFLVKAKPGADGPSKKDDPIADLTDRCTDVVSVVFDDTIEVAKGLVDEESLRLFVVVDGEVTDMIPLEGDIPQPDADERRRFQKKAKKSK